MERIYENGGDLKKTLNVVENEKEKIIRWLEEGTTGEGGTGWNHILERHKDQFMEGFGLSSESEIETLIYKSIKEGLVERTLVEELDTCTI